MPDPFVRQITLIIPKFSDWLNSTKSLLKAMFFKCRAQFLHSSRNRVGIPRLVVSRGYLCLRGGKKVLSVMFPALPFVSIVVLKIMISFLEFECGTCSMFILKCLERILHRNQSWEEIITYFWTRQQVFQIEDSHNLTKVEKTVVENLTSIHPTTRYIAFLCILKFS